MGQLARQRLTRTTALGRWTARLSALAALMALVLMAEAAGAAPELVRKGGEYRLLGTSLELTWDAARGALKQVVHRASGLVLLEGAPRPFDLHLQEGWVQRDAPARARELGALVLDGQWDFHTEGGGRRKIRVPGAWEEQGVNKPGPQDPDPSWQPYNGTAYYQRTFDLPVALQGKDLELVLQRVDDFDWVTINGQAIGHTGDEVEEWWAKPRRYEVPAKVLKPTGNVIEVKVYDRGGEGGLLGSVMLLEAGRAAALDRPALELVAAHLSRRGSVAVVTLRYEGLHLSATETYEVATKGRGFFVRRVELVPLAGVKNAKFDQAELELGHLGARLVKEGRIAAPYYWPPLDEPVAEFVRRGRQVYQPCSQAVTGVGVYHEPKGLALA
ncbi:MAG: hypothetical protein J7M26_08830, partial [Armatimonadetes bacterium]|nr:hypothetical protein [Armatimonadota bacterium]